MCFYGFVMLSKHEITQTKMMFACPISSEIYTYMSLGKRNFVSGFRSHFTRIQASLSGGLYAAREGLVCAPALLKLLLDVAQLKV